MCEISNVLNTGLSQLMPYLTPLNVISGFLMMWCSFWLYLLD